jgi:hypothetical protein
VIRHSTTESQISVSLSVGHRVDPGAFRHLAQLLFGSIDQKELDGIGTTSTAPHMMVAMSDQLRTTGLVGGVST